MKEINPCIIRRIQKGKRNAFRKLVDHYQQAVYHVCYLITGNEKAATELAMDTFIFTYENIHAYHANQRFSLWLFQNVIFLARKRLLEDKKESCPLVEKLHPLFTSNLSCTERIVLNLKINNELSFQEIEEVLGTKATLISTYINTAREKIRENLNEQTFPSTLSR